ncbi:MAG: response regulator [Acidobacteriota bacterium]
MKRILLVDDAETILMMEKMILADHYDVVTAANGQEAVQKTLSDKPDLVLMDVMMPKMTGIEACRALQKNPATSGTPVIIVTTRSDSQSVQEALLAGCIDYVTKPVDGVELLAKVRNVLGE